MNTFPIPGTLADAYQGAGYALAANAVVHRIMVLAAVTHRHHAPDVNVTPDEACSARQAGFHRAFLAHSANQRVWRKGIQQRQVSPTRDPVPAPVVDR